MKIEEEIIYENKKHFNLGPANLALIEKRKKKELRRIKNIKAASIRIQKYRNIDEMKVEEEIIHENKKRVNVGPAHLALKEKRRKKELKRIKNIKAGSIRIQKYRNIDERNIFKTESCEDTSVKLDNNSKKRINCIDASTQTIVSFNSIMSDSGRPRRSAAAASNKVWASLMSKKSDGEEDVYDDAQETTRKRTASKESIKTPARGKKAKLSESNESETVVQEPAPQTTESPSNTSLVSPKSQAKSPPKKLTGRKAAIAVATSDAAELQKMEEDFDKQNAILPPTEELVEEDEAPPAPPAKPTPSRRGRPSKIAPPSLTGMDDPKDADYVLEEEKKPRVAPVPKPRPIQMPTQRAINPVRAVPSRPVTFRPTIGPRVVYPNRIPTIVNGAPRVVQPKYPIRPVQNPDLLTKPMPMQNYEPPQSVIADIDRLSKLVKEQNNPTIAPAFELITILREELDRSQKSYVETTQFYQDYVERVQHAVSVAEEESVKRIRTLEQRVANLEGQLKKASAVAHQKLLKGLEENNSPQKVVQQQYVVVQDTGNVDQQPTNYLVQEEEYSTPQGDFYHHESVIQEASKEVDNMM